MTASTTGCDAKGSECHDVKDFSSHLNQFKRGKRTCLTLSKVARSFQAERRAPEGLLITVIKHCTERERDKETSSDTHT